MSSSKVASIIQKSWRERQCENMVIHHDTNEINPMLPETAVEIEYCVKYANFGRKQEMWGVYIERIGQALWEDQYTGGRGAEFYNRVQVACETLKERLGHGSGHGEPGISYWPPWHCE